MTEDSAPTQDVHALVERTLALARLAPLLQSEDYWASIRLLRHGAEREVFAAAVELCRSEDAVSRAVGADTLAGIGYDASLDSHRLSDEFEPVLIGLLSDDSPAVVMSASFSLGHLRRGSTLELARVKAHPASEVREALAYLLGMHDDAISTLIELSTDHDAGTRDWATFGIGTQTDVDTADIRDALTARLEDQDVDVRGEAMVGLARRGDERAVRPIAEGLERGEELAVDAAGELPRLQFVPQLERLAVERPTDPFVTEALFKCRSASE